MLKALSLPIFIIYSHLCYSSDATVSFRGNLISKPECTVSDGPNFIEVDFGDNISAQLIDGINYRKSLNYQIKCADFNGSNPGLTLSLSGQVSTFDNDALATNMEPLGVRIYNDTIVFSPNSSLPLNYSSPPVLEAVLVKKDSGILTEGVFRTWATLLVNYK